jgi:hypothetical protein
MKIDRRLARGLDLGKPTIKRVSDIGDSCVKRLQVAKALPRIEETFRKGIVSFLARDPDPIVREQAAMSLGGTKDGETLRILSRLASDNDPRVRIGVARGLIKYGSKAALPILAALLLDKDPDVRIAAFRAYLRMQILFPEAAANFETAKLAGPSMRRIRKGLAECLSAGKPQTGEKPLFDVAALYEKFDVVSHLLDEGSLKIGKVVHGPGAGPPEASGTLPEAGLQKETQQSVAAEEHPQRFVNSWFEGHSGPQEPLQYGLEYELGIQISPKLRIGSFTRGRQEFVEPESGEESTLDVVAAIVSDDFEVLEKPAKRMRLPRDKGKESPPVTFRVRPVKNNQDIFISVLFYHENNLFHEALIGARAQVLDVAAGSGTTAYFPTENRFQALPQGRRDLNIQVIEQQYGYRLILFHDFGGDQFDLSWCTIPLNRDRVADLLLGIRQKMEYVLQTGVCGPDFKGGVFIGRESIDVPMKEKRLPDLDTIDEKHFQRAARLLALAGRQLFVNLFNPSKGSQYDREQAQLVGKRLLDLSAKKCLKVQVLADDFFIPWNVFYDGDPVSESIDPQAFWGFRHVIEEIPHRVRELEGKSVISLGDEAFGIGMNINTAKISEALTTPQLERARAWAPELTACFRNTEEDVLSALRGETPQQPLEYFYCHAGVGGDSDGDIDQSFLGITSDTAGLTLESIKLQTVAHRFVGSPVFILNACESARMDGRFYDGFVPEFLSMGACAVVGSDAKVPALFGAHFGLALLEGILNGDPLGEVLLAARQAFLRRCRNPLGLIYRVFGSADVHLEKPVVQQNIKKGEN